MSILASRISGAASTPPPELGLDPGLGLEAAGPASPPTEPDMERGMSSSEELKFRAYQSMSILDTLTESDAVFKVTQNTFNIMWQRLPDALGL